MNCSYQCDFAKQNTVQILADHLGMRIASRDALALTKDISCSSIWWRDWFRSDRIALRRYGINITEYPVFVYQIRFLLLFYNYLQYADCRVLTVFLPREAHFHPGTNSRQHQPRPARIPVRKGWKTYPRRPTHAACFPPSRRCCPLIHRAPRPNPLRPWPWRFPQLLNDDLGTRGFYRSQH